MSQSPAFKGYEAIIANNKRVYANKLRIWGGDGEGDGDNGDAGDGGQDSDGQQDQDNQGQGDRGGSGNSQQDADDKSKRDAGKSGDDTDPEARVDALKRENIRLRQQLDNKKEAEKTKEKDESDQQKEYNKVKSRNAQLERMMETNVIETAILKEKKYDWQDVEDVRRFIDMDALHIDYDKGTIQGLDLELKRLAKSKPYLLTPKKQDDQDDGDQGDQSGNQGGNQGGRRQSGGHPYGSARPGRKDLDKDALKAKYKIGTPFRAM